MQISSREKKFLITACGALLLFIFVEFIILPLCSKQNSIEEELILRKSLYERYSNLLEEKDLLNRKIENLKEKIERLDNSLFTGRTQSLIAAELQKYLEQKAREQGLKFKSIGSVFEGEGGEGKFKRIS
ncbi:MAG: hypothetical protein SV062_12150, partial [Thermodesulfobacteriota bacterium]|nr:hypothetical protein [Thermodesulfobacteriota bacterium]